jgi:collagen type I/II/III/V/XI/XXIV/XXVII alpha
VSTFSWNTSANADWATLADWTLTSGTTAAPPGNTNVAPASDVATIIGSSSTAFTVSIATGETFDIATLNYSNVSSTAAPTLSITGTLKLNTLAYSGSQTVTTTIASGGVLVLRTAITDSSGTQTITINSGGTLIGAGLVATGVALSGFGTVEASGGTLDVASAVTALLAIDATTASDLKIDSFGTSRAAIAISSANQTLEIGAAGNLTINGAAAQSVTNGTIKLDGGRLADSSGIVLGSGTSAGTLNGFGTVSAVITKGGSSASNIVEASGGKLILSAAVGATSGLAYEIASTASSVLQLSVAPGVGNTFSFLGAAGDLALGAAPSINETIVGLNVGSNKTPTNFIDILGVSGVTVQTGATGTGTTGTVTLSDGAVLNLSGIINASGTWFVNTASDGAVGTDVFLSTVCYVAGTRILTAAGDRVVESLMQGDIILTLAGGELTAQPVKWLGRRRIDLAVHPRPETVAPIRIRRGAFADNVPHNDLLLSPDHAVFVDGKLICARQLVNGTTIRQEKDWTSVEYFHVELDAHAILLAEGLPAESYLNTGNRGFFANSGESLVLHPDLTDEADYPTREAASCAPFVSDEASVRPVWQRMAERAAALGQPAPQIDTTGDPQLRIVVKGRTIRPVCVENERYTFVLPNRATEVRLVSRAGSPTDVRPWLEDRRCLGVYVEWIVLHGASEVQELPVDHPGLSHGWHMAEWKGASLRRWTNGDAMLPLTACNGPTLLEIRASSSEMVYLTNVDQERRAA